MLSMYNSRLRGTPSEDRSVSLLVALQQTLLRNEERVLAVEAEELNPLLAELPELDVCLALLLNQAVIYQLYGNDKETACKLIEVTFSESAVKIQSIKILFEKMFLQNCSNAFTLLFEKVVSGSNFDRVFPVKCKDLLDPLFQMDTAVVLCSITQGGCPSLYNRIEHVLKILNVGDDEFLDDRLLSLSRNQKYTFLCLVFHECLDAYGLPFLQDHAQRSWKKLLAMIKCSLMMVPEEAFFGKANGIAWGSQVGLDPISAVILSGALLERETSVNNVSSSTKLVGNVESLPSDLKMKSSPELFEEMTFGSMLLACFAKSVQPNQVMKVAFEYGVLKGTKSDNVPGAHLTRVFRERLMQENMLILDESNPPNCDGTNWCIDSNALRPFYALLWDVYLSELQSLNKSMNEWGNSRNFLWKLIADIAQRNCSQDREQQLKCLEESLPQSWSGTFYEAWHIYLATSGFVIPWNSHDFKSLLFECKDEPFAIFMTQISQLLSEPLLKHRYALSSPFEVQIDRIICIEPPQVNVTTELYMNEESRSLFDAGKFEEKEVDAEQVWETEVDKNSLYNNSEEVLYDESTEFSYKLDVKDDQSEDDQSDDEVDRSDDEDDLSDDEVDQSDDEDDLSDDEVDQSEDEDVLSDDEDDLAGLQDESNTRYILSAWVDVPVAKPKKDATKVQLLVKRNQSLKKQEFNSIKDRHHQHGHQLVEIKMGSQVFMIDLKYQTPQSLISNSEFKRLARTEDPHLWSKEEGQTSVTRYGKTHELHTVLMTLGCKDKRVLAKVAIAPDYLFPKGSSQLQAAQDRVPLGISLWKNNVHPPTWSKGEHQLRSSKLAEFQSVAFPQTKEEQLQFENMMSYHSQWLPSLKEESRNLKEVINELIVDKESKCMFNMKQRETLNQVRKQLVNGLEKKFPTKETQLVIHTKASNKLALGWFGYEIEGIFYPTKMFSKPFNDKQAKGSTTQREVAAQVWAIEKFRHQFERTVKLYCNHRVMALVETKMENQNQMLHRQQGLISEHQLDLGQTKRVQSALFAVLARSSSLPRNQRGVDAKSTIRSKTIQVDDGSRNSDYREDITPVAEPSTHKIVLATVATEINTDVVKQTTASDKQVYCVDDLVMVFNNVRNKTHVSWCGPYQVNKVDENGNCLLRTPRGQIRKKNVAVQRLKLLSKESAASFKENDTMVPERIVQHRVGNDSRALSEHLIAFRGYSVEDCEWFPVDDPAVVRLAAIQYSDGIAGVRKQVLRQAKMADCLSPALYRNDKQICHPTKTR